MLRSTDELRALSSTIVTGGAAAIPEGFGDRLEAALLWASPIRMHATVERTEHGGDVPYPLTNDTANEGVILQENVAETEQDMTFTQLTLHAYKFSSQKVLVPNELIEDSPLLASRLGWLLGLRIGRRQNRAFSVGNGASQPLGVVNLAPVGATSGGSSVITDTDVTNLLESVDPAYRQNARFQCHQQTWAQLCQLRDGAGHPIYPQYWPGQRVMAGYPVELNPHMATVTNSSISLLFGDFSFVQVRDVRELRLKSYSEATGLAEADQTAYSAILRSDAILLDAGTGPVKSLQQHA